MAPINLFTSIRDMPKTPEAAKDGIFRGRSLIFVDANVHFDDCPPNDVAAPRPIVRTMLLSGGCPRYTGSALICLEIVTP
jgi:hypothetical protein